MSSVDIFTKICQLDEINIMCSLIDAKVQHMGYCKIISASYYGVDERAVALYFDLNDCAHNVAFLCTRFNRCINLQPRENSILDLIVSPLRAKSYHRTYYLRSIFLHHELPKREKEKERERVQYIQY